jgi:hypothetical protein
MGKMKVEPRCYFLWLLFDKDTKNLTRNWVICIKNSKQLVKTTLQQWNISDQLWFPCFKSTNKYGFNYSFISNAYRLRWNSKTFITKMDSIDSILNWWKCKSELLFSPICLSKNTNISVLFNQIDFRYNLTWKI